MKDAMVRFENALSLLPENIRSEIVLPRRVCINAEEIRLRAGQRISVLLPEGEIVTGERVLTSEDLDGVVEIATKASAYSVRESVKAGYITAKGGCRIGLCGSAVVKSGETEGFRKLSSLSIRIPKEVTGIAKNVMTELINSGGFDSVLIISPPGGGKTTLLRDMVRFVSDGDTELGFHGMRVSVADERGEIACMHEGVPERDIGIHTDVLEGCPKAQAVMILLRAMNPQVIALDEITASEDTAAILSCANCGVKLIATAHGENMEDLMTRQIYRSLIENGVFRYAVIIEKTGGRRKYTVMKTGGGIYA